MAGVTCKDAADGHFVHTSIDNFTGNIFCNQLIWTNDDCTSFRMLNSLLGVATLQTLFQWLDHLFAIGDRGDIQTTVSTTVVLTDDDILGHVNQTTSQITRVGRLQGRIRHTLTGTVSREEHFQYGETLAEVRQDWQFHDSSVRS